MRTPRHSGAGKSVAILGASSNHAKFGNKSVRAHLAAGYEVLPVHPTESSVEGLTVYPSLAALPHGVERISVYLPPAVSLTVLPEIARSGASEVWFNPGAADDAVLDEAKRLGIPAIDGCSIVDLGLSPSEFP
ncbi:MAG: CoA-binding protein [Thermoanaerobaculia bacterium]